jgi:glycosyltransferase involved in cell wall biosynthesis
VVVPFFNEEECVEAVCVEIIEVMGKKYGRDWEFIAVDDGSSDKTHDILTDLQKNNHHLRVIRILEHFGKSAAHDAGFKAAKSEIIGTLDGDGQNDPAQLPMLLDELRARDVDFMIGIRVDRQDNWVRKMSGRLANKVRSAILKDDITDVGCALRVFKKDCLEKVHVFRNDHRFFPALFIMNGFTVAEVPVNHRNRFSGTSKYGGGIRSRLWVGLADLAGVFWLSKRIVKYKAVDDREGKPVGQ